ncbi:DsbA family protein [Pendulispora albinea]|uniref:DsbA family protein n=1 Tax=Pendulispora albinea TaxID=2741071 RepID=A0ABZ2LXE5_9BACT
MTFAHFKAGLLLVAALGSVMRTAACHGSSASGGAGETAKDPQTPADVNLPGVDTSVLTPREKGEWSTYVNEFLSPCADTPVPIAQCVKEKRACAKCVPAAKFLVKGVRDGQARDQIEKSYKNRFDAANIKNVPIEGSPTRGPESAPVTIVEFADFECPFCAMFAPILDKTVEDNQSRVRFVYKFMPLPGHPHGEIAARAGFAAWKQGKFWEMDKKMFANREHLEQSDLESYAKELGLDVAKFKADAASAAATERLAADKKLADALQVRGTPTIYINGREFDPRTAESGLKDWIATELAMNGIDPKAPAAAASAPDASTATPAGAHSGRAVDAKK